MRRSGSPGIEPASLIAEVQSHLDATTVRAVALQPTAGLRRGTEAQATGEPITMPVGDAVLGRLLNVLGESATAAHRCRPT